MEALLEFGRDEEHSFDDLVCEVKVLMFKSLRDEKRLSFFHVEALPSLRKGDRQRSFQSVHHFVAVVGLQLRATMDRYSKLSLVNHFRTDEDGDEYPVLSSMNQM